MEHHFFSRVCGLIALVSVTAGAVGCMSTSGLSNSMESLGLTKPKSASEQRMMEIARTYEEHGNVDNARRIYSQVLKRNVSAENRQVVEERLAALEKSALEKGPGRQGKIRPQQMLAETKPSAAEPSSKVGPENIKSRSIVVKPEIAQVNGFDDSNKSIDTQAVVAALAEADQFSAHADAPIYAQSEQKVAQKTEPSSGDVSDKDELATHDSGEWATRGDTKADADKRSASAIESQGTAIENCPVAKSETDSCEEDSVANLEAIDAVDELAGPEPFPGMSEKDIAPTVKARVIAKAPVVEHREKSEWRATQSSQETEAEEVTGSSTSSARMPVQSVPNHDGDKKVKEQGEGGFWRSTHSSIMPEAEQDAAYEANWLPTQHLLPPGGDFPGGAEHAPANSADEECTALEQAQADRKACELLAFIFEQGNLPELAPEVRAEMERMLADDDQMVALLCAETLLKHGIMHEQIPEIVVRSLYSSDEAVRMVAVHVLSPGEKHSLEYSQDLLLAKTTDDTTVVRRLAILELGGIQHPSNLVIAQLKKLVIGDEPDQIQEAAEISLRSIAENLSQTSQMASAR